LAFNSLRPVKESEEVVLDVFAQVWHIVDRYDVQKGRAVTWVFTLACRNLSDLASLIEEKLWTTQTPLLLLRLNGLEQNLQLLDSNDK